MSTEKKDLGHLSLPAKSYITLLSCSALAIASYCAATWPLAQTGQFTVYLLFAIASSKMKVKLPGITGTLSVNYLFILAAVTDLRLPQAVAIGCASGLAQLLLATRRRPRAVQMVFTMASVTVSSALAYGIYHAPWPLGDFPLRLFECSTTYFLANTLSLAGIVALTEGKTCTRVWRETSFGPRRTTLWEAPSPVCSIPGTSAWDGTARYLFTPLYFLSTTPTVSTWDV